MTGMDFPGAPQRGCDVTPTEDGVRQAMQDLMPRLKAEPARTDCCQAVEIALTEALNNIVEHAFAPPFSGARSIKLRYAWDGDLLRIELADNGKPPPDGVLPEGRPAAIDVPRDDLPEGGFGWFLIRSLTRQIRYERHEEINRLTLVFGPPVA